MKTEYDDFWYHQQQEKSIMCLKAEFKVKYYGEGKKAYIRRIANYMLIKKTNKKNTL